MNKYTKMLRKEDVSRDWYHIDAEGQILGRLAVEVATRVMGKKKVDFTPHVASDLIIVTGMSLICLNFALLKTNLPIQHLK